MVVPMYNNFTTKLHVWNAYTNHTEADTGTILGLFRDKLLLRFPR